MSGRQDAPELKVALIFRARGRLAVFPPHVDFFRNL